MLFSKILLFLRILYYDPAPSGKISENYVLSKALRNGLFFLKAYGIVADLTGSDHTCLVFSPGCPNPGNCLLTVCVACHLNRLFHNKFLGCGFSVFGNLKDVKAFCQSGNCNPLAINT